MRREELWAQKAGRIEEFLGSLPELVREAEGFYSGRDVRVSVIQMPDRQLGSLRFPQSRVIFEGSGEVFDSVYRAFVLRFLSAGG